MSHYEERLEADLTEIRTRVRKLGEDVAAALRHAEHAFLEGDRALASRTVLGDHPINRETRAIDRLCHAFVARHLPSAGHLRFVSSVLRVDLGLERIGDYAVSICRETVALTAPPPAAITADVRLLSEQGRNMLERSLDAFLDGNADLARGIKTMADQSKALIAKVWQDLLREADKGSRPTADLFALLVIVNRLERVSAQAKNLCEETVFAATGETKSPKVFTVLFLDESNSRWSQIAEGIARKSFPASGHYASAGWSPATAMDNETLAFLRAHGLDFGGMRPKAVHELEDPLDAFDVVVGLGGDPREKLAEVPFQTTVLTWPFEGDREPSLSEGFAELSARIHDLMELLRGKDAA